MRGRPYCTHNRLKRVFPWSVCTLCREEKSHAQSNCEYYPPSQCGLSWKLQEFLQVMCSLLELKSFRILKELFALPKTCLYSEMCLIGHRCFSVKKVHTLSLEQAANCSTNTSTFYLRNDPINHILYPLVTTLGFCYKNE